ncbi:hypothetical protein COO60DRAFT_957275 [Scenedesmus sp. NREL 46B-D3]|nr:hypothetical protein COO60DRAFT_957275 [Scenedesmus sp. NREL 46B-D3]
MTSIAGPAGTAGSCDTRPCSVFAVCQTPLAKHGTTLTALCMLQEVSPHSLAFEKHCNTPLRHVAPLGRPITVRCNDGQKGLWCLLANLLCIQQKKSAGWAPCCHCTHEAVEQRPRASKQPNKASHREDAQAAYTQAWAPEWSPSLRRPIEGLRTLRRTFSTEQRLQQPPVIHHAQNPCKQSCTLTVTVHHQSNSGKLTQKVRRLHV